MHKQSYWNGGEIFAEKKMYFKLIWKRNTLTKRFGLKKYTSKNKLFSQLVSAVAVLKGYVEFVIYKCWRLFDVILRLTSVILDHMQKRKIMEVNGKSAWNGFNLGLGSDHVALKSQVSLSRSFFAVLVFKYWLSWCRANVPICICVLLNLLSEDCEKYESALRRFR